ncbi:hypothetical protein [Candidatus Electronema sp. JM]|uniref:hypothetical protein n=1 Tax=Candidatus Electronema sp. JM TaxID=3401571 RepID=UPI003AA872F8
MKLLSSGKAGSKKAPVIFRSSCVWYYKGVKKGVVMLGVVKRTIEQGDNNEIGCCRIDRRHGLRLDGFRFGERKQLSA